jgi:hypothetical protein
MPGLMQGDGYTATNMYHSFDYGNVHFVAVSTEPSPSFSSPGTPQYQWLQKDLSISGLYSNFLVFMRQLHVRMMEKLIGSLCLDINHCIVLSIGRIVVIFVIKQSFHLVMCLCSIIVKILDWDEDATSAELRLSFEQLLVEYNVDMYISGHVHSYVF